MKHLKFSFIFCNKTMKIKWKNKGELNFDFIFLDCHFWKNNEWYPKEWKENFIFGLKLDTSIERCQTHKLKLTKKRIRWMINFFSQAIIFSSLQDVFDEMMAYEALPPPDRGETVGPCLPWDEHPKKIKKTIVNIHLGKNAERIIFLLLSKKSNERKRMIISLITKKEGERVKKGESFSGWKLKRLDF